MITSMKIVVICFLVLGPPVSELLLPFGSELKFHLRSDCRTDFAVDVEDALGWAIEIFRPQVDLVTHADQLRGDADAVSLSAHATLEHVVYTEFLTDF